MLTPNQPGADAARKALAHLMPPQKERFRWARLPAWLTAYAERRRFSEQALAHLPESRHGIARNLIRGSRNVWHGFRAHARMKAAYDNDRPFILSPSLPTRLKVVSASLYNAFTRARGAVVSDIRNYQNFVDHPRTLQEGQRPLVAAIGCSDSRMSLADWLDMTSPGQVFMLKTVGGSVESNWNADALSAEASEHLAYAAHIGIKDVVIATHGKCGCIANATSCRHTRPLPRAGADRIEDVLRDMSRRKAHLVKDVERHGVEHFLNILGNGHPDDQQEARLLAMEVAHGLHAHRLVSAFIERLNTEQRVHAKQQGMEWQDIRVTLVHVDFRDVNPYIYDAARGGFIKLTNNPPIEPGRPPRFACQPVPVSAAAPR